MYIITFYAAFGLHTNAHGCFITPAYLCTKEASFQAKCHEVSAACLRQCGKKFKLSSGRWKYGAFRAVVEVENGRHGEGDGVALAASPSPLPKVPLAVIGPSTTKPFLSFLPPTSTTLWTRKIHRRRPRRHVLEPSPFNHYSHFSYLISNHYRCVGNVGNVDKR
jgi:hypothetical protein